MLLRIHPEEMPGPESLESFLIKNIVETEKRITMLNFPLMLLVSIDGHVLSFSVQRDISGLFLMPIEEAALSPSPGVI